MATEQSVLAVIRASRPQFRNSADKVAFAINSILLASGYNLNVTGPQAFTDDALATSSSGIEGWNEFEKRYAFVYSSPEESSKKVLVTCLVMSNQLFVDALAAGSSNPVHLKIKIDDYVAESDDTKYSSQYKNLGKLVDTINKQVISKLNGSSTAITSNATTSSKQSVQKHLSAIYLKALDEIAFTIHSVFMRKEFSLKYTGPQAFADDALPTPLSDEEKLKGWNEVKGNYAFVYSSPERIPRDVLLKCLVINKQLFVDVLASGSSNPIHLELNIDDFISNDTKYGSRCKNLGKLMDCINKQVISKLIGSSRANTTMGMPSHLQSCRGPIPLASRPQFRNSADKVAFAINSILLASGYNLNVTGPQAFTDDALATSSSDEVGIEGWNEVEENYAFVYSSPEESSKKVLVKCLVMNNQLFVDALAAGSSNPVHLEIKIDDYVAESDDTKYSSQYKNLGKLVDTINKQVISKLNGSSTSSTSNATTSSKQSIQDSDRDQPRSGPFGLQDPRTPYYPPGVVMPPVNPYIGGGDLYPQPGAGMYPTRGGFGDGGMLVGPNDPRFFGGGIGGPMGFPGGQPGVPPGARFDPFGPPDVPGFEPNRFTRNPRRPPGGTHPDLEHFGNGSDFI
ncbi:hypothetical protein LXL04_018553 [Taraxacum kok-saghyz]